MNELLSIKLRPKSLEDIIGQEHLVSKGKILYNLVKNKKLFSMILYGHPGIGKTSIALAIVNELDVRYRTLNAVINNKKDIDLLANKYMKDWTIDRVGLTDAAIIEIAIYEIKYTKTPNIVCINEAIELSKKYSDEKVSKMINGVLDKVYKDFDND